MQIVEHQLLNVAGLRFVSSRKYIVSEDHLNLTVLHPPAFRFSVGTPSLVNMPFVRTENELHNYRKAQRLLSSLNNLIFYHNSLAVFEVPQIF
jgi:hypothetical protein